MEGENRPKAPGRGTGSNPANRFQPIAVEWDGEWLEWERSQGIAPGRTPTRYLVDSSRTILSSNDSPDVSFTYSLNPYRGCEHGCIYCYARPSHEFLGFSAGLDFESRILVKPDAAALLARALAKPSWQPQVVGLAGNTDCYQPIERKLRLTRQCLEVFLDFGNPVEIITKSALILRDLDLLRAMAGRNLVCVTISVTTLDAELSAAMEPRAAPPAKRLEAIAELAAAGVPTRVIAAPVIPGLTDHELPSILVEAAARGAASARYIMLRLPQGVEALFSEWLRERRPLQAAKVEQALRQVRGGALSDSRFHTRMRGEGVRADTLARLFAVQCARLGLNEGSPPLSTAGFRAAAGGQQSLF